MAPSMYEYYPKVCEKMHIIIAYFLLFGFNFWKIFSECGV